MRRNLLALTLLVATAGCGDDGKTAPRGTPAAPPGSATPSPAAPSAPPPPAPVPGPAPAPVSPGASTSPWASTRVGDWATWDVKATGADGVTKLTWRATKVDGAGVRFSVEARTLDVQGATVSVVTTEELHPAGDGPLPAGTPETITVAGAALDTRRTTRTEGGASVTVWHAATVPFSGLVRSASATVEQTLVAFGRAP